MGGLACRRQVAGSVLGTSSEGAVVVVVTAPATEGADAAPVVVVATAPGTSGTAGPPAGPGVPRTARSRRSDTPSPVRGTTTGKVSSPTTA